MSADAETRGAVVEYRRWTEVPENLATRTTLRRNGLEPGGPAKARMRFTGGRHTELFDALEARTRQAATPNQLKALRRANAAREKQQVERQKRREELRAARRLATRAAMAEELNEQGARCVELLRAWASDEAAVVLDTETTDIDGVVIEVAVATLAGEVLLEQRVHPGAWPMDAEAQSVHGISLEDLQAAPVWGEVLPTLDAMLEGRTVLVFGLDFDAQALVRTTAAALGAERARPLRKALASPSWQCVQKTLAPLMAEWDERYSDFHWPSLARACAWARADVQRMPPAHSARGDVLRTGALIRAAARLAPRLWTPDDIADTWLVRRAPVG